MLFCMLTHRESAHVAFPARISTTYYLSTTTTHRYLSIMVQRQPPPKCQKLGPSTERAFMMMYVNIEGLSSANCVQITSVTSYACKNSTEDLVKYDIESLG